MRNVARSIPMYVLPYMFFSTQTPSACASCAWVSDARVKFRSCFDLNLRWLSMSSAETPTSATPALVKSRQRVAEGLRLGGAARRVVAGIEVKTVVLP